jgi:hypothetical protein
MIEKLNSKINEVQNKLEEYHQILKNDSSNFALQLAYSSLNSHCIDLVDQKKAIYKLHRKEIFVLRLKGNCVNNGTVPLRLLSNVTDNFALAIQAAATKIEFGKEFKRIPQSVNDILNLRFTDLKAGSSKIYIEANSDIDIFGESLIENSLNAIFKLLNNNSDDDLMKNIEEIGIKSLQKLHDLFSQLIKNNIELDFNWRNINCNEKQFLADRKCLKLWKNRFKEISSIDLPDVKITGEISLLSSSGRIELMTEDLGLIKGFFPLNINSMIHKIHLNDTVDCIFSQYQLLDLSKGTNRIIYTLKTIEEINN